MIAPASGDAVGPGTPDARLREAARQLEGVFIAQLYKAMRQTVPTDGVFQNTPGHETFTGMFDEHMADVFATRLEGSIGDRLYEQLRQQFATTVDVQQGSPS